MQSITIKFSEVDSNNFSLLCACFDTLIGQGTVMSAEITPMQVPATFVGALFIAKVIGDAVEMVAALKLIPGVELAYITPEKILYE